MGVAVAAVDDFDGDKKRMCCKECTGVGLESGLPGIGADDGHVITSASEVKTQSVV